MDYLLVNSVTDQTHNYYEICDEWPRSDSNTRPQACHACAPPTKLRDRKETVYVYVVLINDRHADIDVEVFATEKAAMEAAKNWLKNFSDIEDIEEKQIGGWLYFATYSSEGKYVSVEKLPVSDVICASRITQEHCLHQENDGVRPVDNGPELVCCRCGAGGGN